jgi:phage FluMu protein Com
MQLRCFNCHRPFALNKEQVYVALNELTEQNLGHYNAQCPHCRRVNRISKDELMRSAPDWKPGVAEQSQTD